MSVSEELAVLTALHPCKGLLKVFGHPLKVTPIGLFTTVEKDEILFASWGQ